MARCERLNDGGCVGRVEWHHAIQYQNKRLQAVWCIIALCIFHHRGSGKNDEKARWIALRYATPEDLRKCPKVNWEQMKKYLDGKYGCG